MPDTPESQIEARREELARKLSETREYLGLSQQEVAEASGLPRTTISAMETARRRIESVELEALARVYKLPVTHFLSAGAQEEAPEVTHLARAARELAPTDRQELLKYAEFLKAYRKDRS